MKALSPPNIAPPFGAYSHGVETGCQKLVFTSGQLGITSDGFIPKGIREQANVCFQNISAILTDAGMGASTILRLNAFVTDRAHFADYMAARDAFLEECVVKPASTLVIVSGFSRPEFLVEVEATAGVAI